MAWCKLSLLIIIIFLYLLLFYFWLLHTHIHLCLKVATLYPKKYTCSSAIASCCVQGASLYISSLILIYLTFILCCLVTPRIGDKFYCNHCKKSVGKSTFYEHQTLYGDNACGFSNQNVELELDMDSHSENEGALPCWDDEGSSFQKEILVVMAMM